LLAALDQSIARQPKAVIQLNERAQAMLVVGCDGVTEPAKPWVGGQRTYNLEYGWTTSEQLGISGRPELGRFPA
jgi:hypothetical protein